MFRFPLLQNDELKSFSHDAKLERLYTHVDILFSCMQFVVHVCSFELVLLPYKLVEANQILCTALLIPYIYV